MKQCTHLNQIHDVTPNTNGYEEYLKMRDTLVPRQNVVHLQNE